LGGRSVVTLTVRAYSTATGQLATAKNDGYLDRLIQEGLSALGILDHTL
jgi:hypothetical protein